MEIKIKHQEDKTEFKFRVKNADKLTNAEVNRICIKMRVKSIFVNGKYYSL
jgi:hypothetical protein